MGAVVHYTGSVFLCIIVFCFVEIDPYKEIEIISTLFLLGVSILGLTVISELLNK